MSESKVNVTQLQHRDPSAWTMLLRHELDCDDVTVTAVAVEPLHSQINQQRRHLTRFILTLADHTDPITLIGKRTNQTELTFYRNIAPQLPDITPHCWFTHLHSKRAWLLLDEVPAHFAPADWQPDHVETIINEIAHLHALYWQQDVLLHSYGFNHFVGTQKQTLDDLRQTESIYFEEGPAALISEHAIHNAGRLAATLLKAANGLAVMRSLGGWPGILGESHLAAATDLIDDPVPMLQPLLNLPITLLHGNPHTDHWRLTLFDDHRLLDWHKAQIGPGVMDLVSFVEQFDLLYNSGSKWGIDIRPERDVTDETMIDSYMLTMSAELGPEFDGRAIRQAIPAARCLYVLSNWFTHFAGWFADMPNQYTWQKINRMNDEELVGTAFEPIVGFRPYLADVFYRFLQAYRML